ncbi:MAG: excinuclease ABC subunit UvrA, partial [Planctomycetia bacterium]|nr:excinuclease ABC subunit UvrA [Planctomycetia bacterium]
MTTTNSTEFQNGESIIVRGARQHNLKNITLAIPRDRLVVITGLSGSGKSSLAFDTLYAEGQRRYVESLSAYARQFLDQMERPDVDAIEGLPPTIAIEQRRGAVNPRSTVATSTEIHDYLRVLFARVGTPYCPKCGKPIRRQKTDQIVESVMRLKSGTHLMVLGPLIRGQKGEHREALRRVVSEGFVRVRVDGRMYEVTDVPTLLRSRRHTIEVVVDRLVARDASRSRLADSIDVALRLSDGIVIVAHERAKGGWTERLYSELHACPKCSVSFEELSPRMFSFNSPYGACRKCGGLGIQLEFDEDLIVPKPGLSLRDGAIGPWRSGAGRRFKHFYAEAMERFSRDFDVDLSTPFSKLPLQKRQILLRGTTGAQAAKFGASWDGVVRSLKRQFEDARSHAARERLLSYMTEQACSSCGGSRLRPESLAVRLAGQSIQGITAMSISAARGFFTKLRLAGQKQHIGRQVIREIRQRLAFMDEVGLGYLTLDRSSSTLSGGEAQRVRLATQIGSGLVGVCYVLDEPTIGLHARDNSQLLATLKNLRDLGNTVILVEHDEDTIRSADHVVDMGPGAGASGGWIVAEGPLEKVLENEHSLTGQYLVGKLSIPLPHKRRRVTKRGSLVVNGATENNLKNIKARIPLGA